AQAYDTREAQFAQKVNLALRSVADQLLLSQGDTITQVPAIEREAANSFLVTTNRHFRIGTLDSLLKSNFHLHGITTDYEYAMLQSGGDDKLLLGNFVRGNTVKAYNFSCKTREQDAIPYNFTVTFPNMGGHVLQSMGIWIFSSVAMIAVLLIFALLLVFLLREKRLAKMKKNFINNLTHELKTPITNISIASEVMMMPQIAEGEKRQVYAGIIHKETQRLKVLVNRVLQISVLESGKIALVREEVDLHALIREVIHVVSPRILARKGRISSVLDATDAIIFADRHHLLNTLYNLIDNADKYSPESPEIRISTHNGKDGIHIEVLDKGKGIIEEKQKLIFDKFYRVEDGDVQSERGFGLGLSYVKLILKAHGGRIGIRSKPGNGSCFTIFLPFNTEL
ncbi:MAG TPA: HAMP domain-containing histidine kinase, partial [Bacteroidetes bacterium]|nr:HAMP domain-containing histidine kinase [Bacteroidota bacterium]